MNTTSEVHRPTVLQKPVFIRTRDTVLNGDLWLPAEATGMVLFAHGSGSSRHSPRNLFVAEQLHEYGLATLLMDLLSHEEEAEDERTMAFRFDIDLLARRLIDATRWVRQSSETRDLPMGYFGASTGAAAALVAAAECGPEIAAVVSRGGRPDLAGAKLRDVTAPTLLIVGSEDHQVLALNRDALNMLAGLKKLIVVPYATHLFEEPGALEQVADHAGWWFARYLTKHA